MSIIGKIKALFVAKEDGVNAKAKSVTRIAARVKRAGSNEWEDLGTVYDSSKKGKELK